MMAKKRRRKKKNRQQDGDFYDDAGNAPISKGEDIVDDFVFRLLKWLGIRIQRKLFRECGFECIECGWQTQKVGIRGRNAVRGHLKIHVNDKRAKNHLRVYVWGGLLLVLVVAILSVVSELNLDLSGFPSVGFSLSAVAGPALAGTSILDATGLIAFEQLYVKNTRRRWRIGYFVSLGLGVIVLLAEAVVASGVGRIDVALPWFFSGLLPICALAVTRADFAVARLRQSRRGFPPRSYFGRYRAITADGDVEFMEVQTQVEEKIRKGLFDTNRLEDWQKRALLTLQVTKVRRRV